MKYIQLLLLTTMLRCAPETPHWERRCVKSHNTVTPVYGQAGQAMGGMHAGGGMYLVVRQHCDVYDSTWVIPNESHSP